MPDIAMGALTLNGTVLLARRGPKRKVHPNCWSLPGGHVEDGEEAETAMRRELMEEIDVTPERWQFVERFVSEGSAEGAATFHLYYIDRWRGCPRIVDDEHIELRWFTAAAIAREAELMPPQIREILQNLTHIEEQRPFRSDSGHEITPEP